MLGAGKAVEICDALAATQGPRFTPPQLLRDLAASGETFYARFSPQEQAA